MIIVVHGEWKHNLLFTKELLANKLSEKDIKFRQGEFFIETDKNRYLFKLTDSKSLVGLRYDERIYNETLERELDEDRWIDNYER